MSKIQHRFICCTCGNPGVTQADQGGLDMLPSLLRLKLQCNRCADRHRPIRTQPTDSDKVAAQVLRWVPPEYRVNNLSQFPHEPFENCRWWTPGKRGLLLYGPSRRCKSRIAYWVAMRQIELHHVTQCYDCRTFRATVEERIRDNTLWKWYEELTTTPVLLFDDLGKFRGENKRIEEELFNVVKLRVESEQGMIVTSNLDPHELARQFSQNIGVPLIERISESCMPVSFYTAEEERERKQMPHAHRSLDL